MFAKFNIAAVENKKDLVISLEKSDWWFSNTVLHGLLDGNALHANHLAFYFVNCVISNTNIHIQKINLFQIFHFSCTKQGTQFLSGSCCFTRDNNSY